MVWIFTGLLLPDGFSCCGSLCVIGRFLGWAINFILGELVNGWETFEFTLFVLFIQLDLLVMLEVRAESRGLGLRVGLE